MAPMIMIPSSLRDPEHEAIAVFAEGRGVVSTNNEDQHDDLSSIREDDQQFFYHPVEDQTLLKDLRILEEQRRTPEGTIPSCDVTSTKEALCATLRGRYEYDEALPLCDVTPRSLSSFEMGGTPVLAKGITGGGRFSFGGAIAKMGGA